MQAGYFLRLLNSLSKGGLISDFYFYKSERHMRELPKQSDCSVINYLKLKRKRNENFSMKKPVCHGSLRTKIKDQEVIVF